MLQAGPADEEMAEASPLREAPAEETSVPRAADIEMGGGLPVDQAFLDALPADLRAEMMATQTAPPSVEPQSLAEGAGPATNEAAAQPESTGTEVPATNGRPAAGKRLEVALASLSRH